MLADKINTLFFRYSHKTNPYSLYLCVTTALHYKFVGALAKQPLYSNMLVSIKILAALPTLFCYLGWTSIDARSLRPDMIVFFPHQVKKRPLKH